MSLIPFILDLADELHEFSRCLANGIDINDFGFGLYTGTDQAQQSQPQHQQNQQQQQQQQPQSSPRRSRTSSFSSFWMPSKRHHPYNRIKTACCAAKSGSEEALNAPEKSDAGSPATSSSSSASIGGTPGKSASYSVVNKNGFQVSMNVKQFAPNELSVKTIDNCIVVEGRHDDKEDGHGVISRHFVRKYMLPKGYDPNDVLSTLSSDGILTVKAPPPPPPAAKNDEPNERIIEIQPTPGPTPVLVVVSAKDTPTKEVTKKIAATTPSVRLECQLPEKRQKLDLPPEPEPEESTETPPLSATATETNSASTAAVAGVELETDDIEMEKADEQISETLTKQLDQQSQQKPGVGNPENDVEKKAEFIEQMEKNDEKQLEENIEDETEKKLLEECMAEPNGEKMEEFSCDADAAEATEKINDTSAEIDAQKRIEKSIVVTKMEIDGSGDGHTEENVTTKTDNKELVVATIKTADTETKTSLPTAAKSGTNSEKTNTNENDTSSAISTTITSNNKICTNKSSTTTNTSNSSTDSVTENSANNLKDKNGIETGDIPVDISKTDDSKSTATENTKAESVAVVGELEFETAVLSADNTTTTTTTTIIDDVALLKAATADPAVETDTAEENVILTESIDGITTTTDSNTTAVDNVDCSLFAKKTHLGNGNNTSATPLVGTEEMAN